MSINMNRFFIIILALCIGILALTTRNLMLKDKPEPKVIEIDKINFKLPDIIIYNSKGDEIRLTQGEYEDMLYEQAKKYKESQGEK